MVVPAPPLTPVAAQTPDAGVRSRQRPEPKERQRGPVEVTLTKTEVEITESDRQYVEQAIKTAAAASRLKAWGELRESVEVQIVPIARTGSEAFGLAIGNNLVLLRAPRDTPSWGHALPYEDAAVHELAHILETSSQA
jgi:hypothetical protein